MRVQLRRVQVEGRSVYQLMPWKQETVLFSSANRAEAVAHARKNGWHLLST